MKHGAIIASLFIAISYDLVILILEAKRDRHELRSARHRPNHRPFDASDRRFLPAFKNPQHRTGRGCAPLAVFAPLSAFSSRSISGIAELFWHRIYLAQRPRWVQKAFRRFSEHGLESRHISRLCRFHAD